jgi:hypothetical protein
MSALTFFHHHSLLSYLPLLSEGVHTIPLFLRVVKP